MRSEARLLRARFRMSAAAIFSACGVECKAPVRWTRASDEDIDEAAGALLPAGQSGGVEDADEGTDEVVRIRVRAKIAAGDGALNGGYEGVVNERAGAFDQSHRAARDGIHGRDDEPFAVDMVDEEKHPGAKRFNRRHGVSEALFGCRKLFDFAAIDSFDEDVASWKVAIEGGIADAGSACDIVEARSRSIAGENFLSYLKDALAVALRVGAGFAGWRGW